MFKLSSQSFFLVFALAFMTLFSNAQAHEPAFVTDPNDTSVQWGPCPAFIGKGCQTSILNGDPAKPNLDIFF
jgi:hypothetical protein